MNTTHKSANPGSLEYSKLHLSLDSYSLALLAPLINDYPYLAFSASSLRPFCLNHILNDIVINNRREIIEFGSGISTIMIGRLMKKNNLNISMVSIDHDKDWIENIRESLEKEGISNVNLVHAPLSNCSLALSNNDWYDLERLEAAKGGKRFDLVIVDGPPAWEVSKQLARYPALPFVLNNLSLDSAIYLDDANRNGERVVLKTWREKYNIQFNIAGDTLAFAHRGKAFHTEPSKW